MAVIKVGTASWTDPTLISCGRFYPSWAKSAEARLRFYASQFPFVEVDSAFYSLPSEATSGLWVKRTPGGFTFDIKTFRLFTRHQTPLTALPRDIENALPERLKNKSVLYESDLSEEVLSEIWQRFERALLPLDSAGRLGVILFQFPPWFTPGRGNLGYILRCKKRLPQYKIAVEFRNNLWLNEKNLASTLDFLRQNDLAFVVVDEPQGFPSSVPAVVEATSDIAVVRFHGRNKETWEKKGITTAERFNYLYSRDELSEWVPKVKKLSEKIREAHVIFNNCYEDKAVANACDFKGLTSGLDLSFDRQLWDEENRQLRI